jgi:hypothetical protein
MSVYVVNEIVGTSEKIMGRCSQTGHRNRRKECQRPPYW